MVTVAFDDSFKRAIRKMKNRSLKERVKKQIKKIVECPKSGKPMRYGRKNTLEVYVPPFRLSYV